MSSVEIPLHGARSARSANGSFTFMDPVQPAQMRDLGGKKRDRCGDLLLADDSEAAGWSSAMLDRSLALRRRRGPSPSSFHRGCLVVTEAQNSRDQETAPAVVAEEILERQGSEKEPTVEELVYWTVI
ncbi:hypothetical protein CFC21_056686 [Triticum aestivum]|uniref:Uncharacterized protein n=2 Tax=Triticum aestivum TaxID=4565 RepID=A0A9R1GJI4_WHEAT|nr:hypothetical protein CFC21_056686 [Triticum aestivum]